MPVLIQNNPHFNPDPSSSGTVAQGLSLGGSAYDATIAVSANNPAGSVASATGAANDPAIVTGATLPPGMTSLVLDEQWNTIDSSRWGNALDGETYGSTNNSIGRYRSVNTTVSAATSGGTGNSVKMVSRRESYNGAAFTGGMLSTRTVGVYYPIFGRYEMRAKVPHGQGIWPAFWLRHRNGASMCEVDIMEYFHATTPAKYTMTLHRTNNAGTFQTNVNKTYGGVFFEAPTITPDWHVYAVDILPEGSNVRFIGYLDGVEVWNYLDTQAVRWASTNGTSRADYGYGENVFDVVLQGSQIGGTWVGHPDDPTGYSRWNDTCLSGGSKPNSCNISVGGYSIWTDANQGGTLFPNTFEVDYVRIWSAL